MNVGKSLRLCEDGKNARKKVLSENNGNSASGKIETDSSEPCGPCAKPVVFRDHASSTAYLISLIRINPPPVSPF